MTDSVPAEEQQRVSVSAAAAAQRNLHISDRLPAMAATAHAVTPGWHMYWLEPRGEPRSAWGVLLLSRAQLSAGGEGGEQAPAPALCV